MISLVLATTLGVLCLGPEADEAAECQHTVEVQLAAIPGVTVRGAAALGSELGRPVTLSVPSSARGKKGWSQAQALLKKAVDAYYDGRAAAAWTELEKIDALGPLDESWWPVEEQIGLRLWRATILLALDDTVRAQAETRAALTLDPQLNVDLAVYPPAVKTTAEAARKRLRNVDVVVEGLPDDAVVTVDGRALGTSFSVPAGRHHLAVQALGRRPVETWFEVAADRALPMYLPVLLDASAEEHLRQVMSGGKATEAATEVLTGLNRRAKTDGLAVLWADGSRARAIVWLDDQMQISPISPLLDAADWVEATLAETLSSPAEESSETASATGAQTGQPPPQTVVATPAKRKSWDVRATAAVGPAILNYSIQDSTGERYAAELAGASIRAQVDGHWKIVTGLLSWHHTSFGRSTINVTDDTGTPVQSLQGGGLTVLCSRVGARYVFGDDGFRVGGGVGWTAAAYKGDDAYTGSQALGVQPSWHLSGAGVFVQAALPFRIRQVRMETELGSQLVIQPTFWVDGDLLGSPADTSQGDVWLRAGGEMSRWYAGLRGQLSLFGSTFTGIASVPIDPPITDGALGTVQGSLAFELRRAF